MEEEVAAEEEEEAEPKVSASEIKSFKVRRVDRVLVIVVVTWVWRVQWHLLSGGQFRPGGLLCGAAISKMLDECCSALGGYACWRKAKNGVIHVA